jgi:hypothetical protein
MFKQESVSAELNLLVSKCEIQSFILQNYKSKLAIEICNDLKVSLIKFAANRLALGGVINELGIIQLDESKATAILNANFIKLSIVRNKIKKLNAIKKLNPIKKEKKEVKPKNTYVNHEGVYKNEAREKMVNAITSIDSPIGVIPTLPSFTCKLESLILEKIGRGISFIGCERDFDTFHKMVNTIAESTILKRTIVPKFGEIGDVIFNAKKDNFAHLILDYCGTINSFHKEIEYAIQNDLVKVNGTLSITLSKNGIGNNIGIVGKLLRQFPDGCFGDEKETEIGVKLFFNKVMKPNYKVETFFNYFDSSPMMLIIVRRIE